MSFCIHTHDPYGLLAVLVHHQVELLLEEEPEGPGDVYDNNITDNDTNTTNNDVNDDYCH